MAESSTNVRSPFDAFDPNADSKQQPTWGLFDGSRFRTYARNQRGHAINAFHSAHEAKLYEFFQRLWVERAYKTYGNAQPTHCTHCGASTMKPYSRYDFRTNTMIIVDPSDLRNAGTYAFARERPGGKIADPLVLHFLCTPCKQTII